MTMKQQILDRVEECFQTAEKFYGKAFPRARGYEWKRNGVCGGWYQHGSRTFMFQLDLAEANPETYLNVIVPHEVAHCIQRTVYGLNCTPHGKEWKYVMQRVFGLRPDRCHSMDTSVTKTRQVRRWKWYCSCRDHDMTTNRHNQMNESIHRNGNSGRKCLKCHTILEPKKVDVWRKSF
jgi:SprT protein